MFLTNRLLEHPKHLAGSYPRLASQSHFRSARKGTGGLPITELSDIQNAVVTNRIAESVSCDIFTPTYLVVVEYVFNHKHVLNIPSDWGWDNYRYGRVMWSYNCSEFRQRGWSPQRWGPRQQQDGRWRMTSKIWHLSDTWWRFWVVRMIFYLASQACQ